MRPRALATTTVHPQRARDGADGLCPPVERSTAFCGDEPGYSRLANPYVEAVAASVAGLEGTEAGLLFSSGTAAAAAAVLALVPPGGRVAAARELCADSRHLLAGEAARLARGVAWVDVDDVDGWRRALADGAAVVFVEAVSNPDLRVADLPALSALARAAGAVVVVDSTLATPVNLRPAEHGCDLVLHSASKYLNGHSDVIAGAVCGPERLVARVREVQWTTGACLDPAAAALLARGLRTLHLRMRAHNENGLAVAAHLAEHPEIERVVHPWLGSHPDAALARRLLDGGSGMILAHPRGGRDRARRVLAELELVRPAPTLGGLESLAFLPDDDRAGDAVRLSIGVEDPADIAADLDRALARTAARTPSATAAAR